jgi:hypothetical protein
MWIATSHEASSCSGPDGCAPAGEKTVVSSALLFILAVRPSLYMWRPRSTLLSVTNGMAVLLRGYGESDSPAHTYLTPYELQQQRASDRPKRPLDDALRVLTMRTAKHRLMKYSVSGKRDNYRH